MITIIIILYIFILFVVLFLRHKSNKTKQFIVNQKPIHFSIIIPFKNEEKTIIPLLESFNRAKLPIEFEIILIDDHSTDNSVNIILDQLDLTFKLIRLRQTSGKKYAIKKGVEMAKNSLILTLDADTTFEVNYLINISRLPQNDLTILPVEMAGKTWFQKLNSIEFKWLQLLTFGSIQIKKPILANGANLLFDKSAYLNANKVRIDAEIASGDDVFLLEAIKSENGKINGTSSIDFIVKTNAPNTIKSLINQRKRWINKMWSPIYILVIVGLILYQLSFFCAIYQVSNHILWIIPITIKIGMEWVGTNHLNFKQFFLVLLHQIYYPIYGIVLLFSLPFKSKWKKI